MPFVVRPEDRRRFRRCRRQWDLGATTRRNLEPARPGPALDLDRALRDALAVYYFPGMWEWNRDVVLPLTHQALEKGLTRQRDALAAEAVVPEHFEADLVDGRAILDRYLAWAPSVDRFWPVRVETDFDVALPDLTHPGHDLVSESGDPIRYEGRIDLLVVDEHDAQASETPTEVVVEEGGTMFRRTRIPRPREELAAMGRNLVAEALEMTGGGLVPYPNPAAEHCLACGFRPPCLAMTAEDDPEPILSANYRERPPVVPEEGRLGAVTWSMNRGAAPPPRWRGR